jgi:hypothetical protein
MEQQNWVQYITAQQIVYYSKDVFLCARARARVCIYVCADVRMYLFI